MFRQAGCTEPADAEIFAPLYTPDPFEFRCEPIAPYTPPKTFVTGPGDWITSYIPRLGVTHNGIVVDVAFCENNIFGGTVAHNMKGAGAVITDAFAFSEGNPIQVHRRAESPAHVQAIMRRINASLGQRYHLVAQNCEHFASYAFNGKRESPSVTAWGLLGVSVAACAWFASKK